MRAIALLSWWQLKNAVRTSLTDVRKLIPLLVFAAVILMQALSLVMLAFLRPPMPPAAERILTIFLARIETSVFLCLALIAIGILESGFTGGFLSFSLADVDHLFPAPLARRLVLAYRLAAKTGMAFLQGAFFFAFVVWYPMVALAPYRASFAGGAAALAALFFCLGGFANLSLALKLVFGFGKYTGVRRWILAGIVSFAVYLGLTYWYMGMRGVVALGRNDLVVTLFYPCKLAAEAMMAPLTGRVGTVGTTQLAFFYILSLVLVFTRKEHFYEASLEGSERTARLLQAVREQNWSAIFAIGSEQKGKSSGPTPAAMPAFGRGAGALFWAHLAAACKRPLVNLVGPLLGGILLVVLASTRSPQPSAWLVAGVAAYLLGILTMNGLVTFRAVLQRQPLVRPLPLPAWQVVLADVAPRVFLSCLFAFGAGLSLAFSGMRDAGTVSPLLLVCVPAALLCLNLAQYVTAVWFPDSQDKLQQLLAGFVSLVLTGIAVGIMTPFLAIPLFFRASPWLATGLFLVPSLAGSALFLVLAAYAYRRYQPR